MPSISITNPENITGLNLGTTSPKLGGTIDLSAFRIFKSIFGQNHDLTGFTNFSHIDTFEVVNLKKNKLSGNFPDFSSSTNCRVIELSENQFTGEMPQTFPSSIQTLRLFKNDISSGVSNAAAQRIPALGSYSSFAEFNISNQSNTYDGVQMSGSTKWHGPSAVANDFTVPSSMRIFNISNTRIARFDKVHILAAFHHAFQSVIDQRAIDGTTEISSSVNNTTYNFPTILVNGQTNNLTGSNSVGAQTLAASMPSGRSLTYLTGLDTTITVAQAKANLQNIGFSLIGF